MNRLNRNSVRILMVRKIFVLMFCISICQVSIAFSQPINLNFPIINRQGINGVGAIRFEVDDIILGDINGFSFQPTASEIESGALLKTDPDLEAVLETAERMRADGNYRVATQLWQAVLQRSGDSLYSRDEVIYYSLVQQVEAILAALPEDGLAAYRVMADAEAKEILASGSGPSDVTALNKIVREYFVSSLGDDAAFQLGCIYLDRFDFIGARRMFEKIATQHPDPDIPREELYSRIALCQAWLGDTESATASLAVADSFNRNSENADLVRRSLGKLGDESGKQSVSENWLMSLGGRQRYGTMKPVPDHMMDGDLVATWQFYYDPRDSYKRGVDTDGSMLSGADASGSLVRNTQESTERTLVESWTQKGWRPAGHLLFNKGQVYFKTGADLSVWDREKVAGASQIDSKKTELDSAIAWRSVWHNSFEIDDATKMAATIRKSYGAYNQAANGSATGFPEPTTIAEIQLFGDQIIQQMSIANNVLYSLEGKSFDDRNQHRPKQVAAQWNAAFRRTRSNYLTAYDATTGEIKWTLPRETSGNESEQNANTIAGEETESPWIEGGGFMASPVSFGDMILVPVNIGGAISIYALDPENEGKTIWKSFLCDEPESGSVPWSTIHLSIDGSDLFVNCGMGVVFVLDPATGTVRFAKRYRRTGTPNEFQRTRGWTVSQLKFSGWSSDLIIPYGRQMICFRSDSDAIEALDRNTGQMIWRSEMSPVGFKVDYILGVYNDMLYAAGSETIVAYDLKGEGRMVWGADQTFDGKQSMGRGVLTPNGIYMPVEDCIYHFDLSGKNGKANVIAKVQVDLGTRAPVGNLYSDGETFWVHGANRLYALGPKNKN